MGELIIFFFFLIFFSSPSQCLRKIHSSEIEEITSNKCLLLGLHDDNELIMSVLRELEVVFCNENDVQIAALVNDSESSLILENFYTDKVLTVIIFYPKIKKDRTCLLMSPETANIAKRYQGIVSTGVLVDYLNEHCNTYRTSSGSLTSAGLLHQQIMRNQFRLQKPSGHCSRVTRLTKKEFYWEYLSRSQPVIIEGGAKEWPAISKWTMQYLREKYEMKDVHVKLTEHGEFEGVESAFLWPGYTPDWIPLEVREKLPFPDLVVVRPATAEMKFSEFVDLVSVGLNQTGISAYLEYSSIPYYMSELEDDIIEPLFVKDLLERRHLNMWLSDGNTLGKLHFDPYDNFLCQLSGEKQVIMFEPHYNENLYESHIPEAILGFDKKRNKFYRKTLLESTSMVMSPVDILNPQLKRFPKFSNANRIECKLKQGDILFMPAFWWHEVQSYPDTKENRNLAVNFWYEPFFTKEFPCIDCRLYFNTHYNHLLYNPPNI